MPISRDEVIWAYRMFLGREPESEDAILDHMKCNSRLALREQMARCPEFLSTKLLTIEKMSPQNTFFYYNSKIDARKLIESNVISDLKQTNGYLTNSFGVLIDPKFFPQILTGSKGTIEDIPIPANWHADMAEFAAAFRAIALARNSFTMIELGCGWGCWMNITGLVAKKRFDCKLNRRGRRMRDIWVLLRSR